MMTDEQLQAVEAREKATTSRDWTHVESRGEHVLESADRTLILRRSENACEIDSVGLSPADFDFIAHARQNIPDLLAEVRLLREHLRDARVETVNASTKAADEERRRWYRAIDGDGTGAASEGLAPEVVIDGMHAEVKRLQSLVRTCDDVLDRLMRYDGDLPILLMRHVEEAHKALGGSRARSATGGLSKDGPKTP